MPAVAARAEPSGDRLASLSIEELSQIEITSVSKRAESLADAPTSVFVITAADIRRSGATTLPEALRLAPNLQVNRASAFEYTVTARGFASSSANKLLVLIDGRSVYSPLFSGVFWDVQDVVLEDVERVEVISGPGGTLWGVNAVNGVINVITRSARDTTGSLVALGGGNQETRGTARFGATLPEGGAYRVYATHREMRRTETESGTRVNDAGHHSQAGFRADGSVDGDLWMLKGDVYQGKRAQPLPGTIVISGLSVPLGNIPVSGSNLTAAWERRLAQGGAVAVQAYYDRAYRDVPPFFGDTQHIVDLQMQHSLGAHGAHQPVWGLQYREGRDRVSNGPYLAFLPERLSQTWISLFAQDEIALRPELQLTLGARAERNDYTGTEFLPTLRVAWKAAPQHLWWGALSRTVRAPSRLDHDTYVPGAPPYLLRGGPEVRAEVANALELGYRGQPTPNASFSATVFASRYKQLRTQEIDPSVTFLTYGNGMRGSTSGFEMWGSWQARPGWRLHGGFTRLRQHLELVAGSNDAAAVANAEGANPSRWWSLRSALDLGGSTELDATLRYVGTLPRPHVPSYTALDVRLGRRMSPGVDVSVTGQNLLGSGHGEFADVATRSYFQRAVVLKAEVRF
jgi:iron complex outermembrane recepter protein